MLELSTICCVKGKQIQSDCCTLFLVVILVSRFQNTKTIRFLSKNCLKTELLMVGSCPTLCLDFDTRNDDNQR